MSEEINKENSEKKEEGFWDKLKDKAEDAWEDVKEGAEK